MRKETKEVSFKELIEDYYKNTYVDHSFQRKGGLKFGSGWSMKNFEDYIDSTWENAYMNSITIIDVEKALEFLLKKMNNAVLGDIEYFESILNKGYRYISIDGNNSSNCIYAFYNNEFKHKTKKPKSHFFKDYHELLQQKWLDNKITLNIISDLTLEEACKLFRNMNSSTALNAQEVRQARPSALSDFIRNVGDEYGEIYVKLRLVESPSELDTRKFEEFVAKFAMALVGKTRVCKSNLDTWYEETASLDSKARKEVSFLFGELKKITDTLKKRVPKTTKFNRGQVFNILFMLKKIRDKGYIVSDPEKLFDVILDQREIYRENDKSLLAQNCAKEDTYGERMDKFSSKPGLDHAKEGYLVEYINNKNNIKKLKEARVIHKKQKRSEISDATRHQAWHLQEGRTRNGKDISLTDALVNRDKYHADHYKPVSKGGDNSVENIEIIEATENLKKGATLSEPHFPHQKQQSAQVIHPEGDTESKVG